MLSYKKNKKSINIALIIISIILLIFIYLNVKTVRGLVNLIFFSFILAYVLKPLKELLMEKFNLSKRLVSIIIILGILMIVGLFFYILIPSLLKELSNIGNILDNIDYYVYNLIKKIKVDNISFFDDMYTNTRERINLYMRDFSVNLFDNLVQGIESIISFAIIPIITYYFLVDGDLIYNKLLLILPTDKRVILKRVIKHMDRVLARYIVSQLLLSIIITVLTTIALFPFKVKFSLILGIFNGLFNIIPYFGPIIGALPAIFIAFLDSPTKAIYVSIIFFIIQQIEGNILSPKITGDSTNMHPIIIIILLLIGEKIGGFIGMIIIIPIGVIIKVIYEDINDYFF